MSYNRWMYAYGNPVNLSDPTGMKPGEDHYKYCEYLTGDDRKYCNRIVRGFNPADKTIADVQWKMYDLDNCENTKPLHEVLPHIVGRGSWIQYGWWWQYLLDSSPGWWNNNGKSHIYFRDVIAFALGVELSSKGSNTDLIGYAAGAFATKGLGGSIVLLDHAKVLLKGLILHYMVTQKVVLITLTIEASSTQIPIHTIYNQDMVVLRDCLKRFDCRAKKWDSWRLCRPSNYTQPI
jgi:hypothetical protein